MYSHYINQSSPYSTVHVHVLTLYQSILSLQYCTCTCTHTISINPLPTVLYMYMYSHYINQSSPYSTVHVHVLTLYQWCGCVEALQLVCDPLPPAWVLRGKYRQAAHSKGPETLPSKCDPSSKRSAHSGGETGEGLSD